MLGNASLPSLGEVSNLARVANCRLYYKESKLLPKKVLYTFRLANAKIQCEESFACVLRMFYIPIAPLGC